MAEDDKLRLPVSPNTLLQIGFFGALVLGGLYVIREVGGITKDFNLFDGGNDNKSPEQDDKLVMFKQKEQKQTLNCSVQKQKLQDLKKKQVGQMQKADVAMLKHLEPKQNKQGQKPNC